MFCEDIISGASKVEYAEKAQRIAKLAQYLYDEGERLLADVLPATERERVFGRRYKESIRFLEELK